MMKFFVFLSILALGLSAFLISTLLSYANIDRTPPIAAFHKVETLNSPIRAGDNLMLRIWRDKNRGDCPVSSSRVAVNADGNAYELPSGKWAGGSSDDKFLEYGYPTLPTMPDGEWQLRVDLSYHCPDGVTFSYTQPTAFFRIKN